MPMSADGHRKSPGTRLDIPITGMSCAACVRHVEDALRSVSAVEDATVNLGSGLATVRFDPNGASLGELVRAVEKAGYGTEDAATLRLSVDVSATPISSAEHIAHALDGTGGILNAAVNVIDGAVEVKYLPSMATPREIREAVRRLGYAVTTLSEADADTRDVESERRLRGLWIRFVVAAVLALPNVVISMAHVDFPGRPWILLALTLPVLLYSGGPIFSSAWHSARRGVADMNTLIALGTGAAFLYSLAATVAPNLIQPHAVHSVHGIQVYYEAAATIIALILLGRLLEARARQRTGDAIRALMTLEARTALLSKDGHEVEVRVEDVEVGDVVIVRPGGAVPVDGEIIEGASSIDEGMLTGESMPVEKQPGSTVYGGTLNRSGAFRFRATRVGKDTALQRIVQMVREAQGSRAPIQRLADVIAAHFVPVVVGIAVLAAVLWYVFAPEQKSVEAMTAFVTVLIIACPCALGLATPTAVMVGTGRGAEMGVLIRGGDILQAAAGVDTVVLDKTGTVTTGSPVVTDVIPAADVASLLGGEPRPGGQEAALLALAATAERESEHPVGEAIVQQARVRGLQPAHVTSFVSLAGHGVEAVVNGQAVLAGNRRLMESREVDLSRLEPELNRIASGGKTPVVIAVNGHAAGLIAVADTVKPDSRSAVRELRRMGLEVWLVTGDNRPTAEAVARQVGIDNVLAEVLPQHKADTIARLQAEGKRVAMVGDGINDAPALVVANVGIAIGTGADVAIEAADITLARGDLQGVVTALALSRSTMRTIKQNLFWAFIYNVIGIPVAAGALYPVFGLRLNPMLASAAMSLSSVSVVTNSLRLRAFGRHKGSEEGT